MKFCAISCHLPTQACLMLLSIIFCPSENKQKPPDFYTTVKSLHNSHLFWPDNSKYQETWSLEYSYRLWNCEYPFPLKIYVARNMKYSWKPCWEDSASTWCWKLVTRLSRTNNLKTLPSQIIFVESMGRVITVSTAPDLIFIR